jgi:integrase/recombinase XerC
VRNTPPRAADLRDRFLARYAGNTRQAYASDLEAFGRWRKTETIAHALSDLLGLTAKASAEVGERYKKAMAAAPELTLRRRISTLRNFCRFAHESGAIPWLLAVNSRVRRTDEEALHATSRDMSGPPEEVILKLRDALAVRGTPEDLRDLAIIDLHFYRCLRRAEVIRLDVGDVDVEKRTIKIRGKGKSVMETLRVTGPTMASIQKWLSVRPGLRKGPLFIRLDRASREFGRLSDSGVYEMLARRGKWIGYKGRIRPHGLRHTSITSAIVRAAKVGRAFASVQKFARHKSSATTSGYLNKAAIEVQEVMEDLPTSSKPSP